MRSLLAATLGICVGISAVQLLPRHQTTSAVVDCSQSDRIARVAAQDGAPPPLVHPPVTRPRVVQRKRSVPGAPERVEALSVPPPVLRRAGRSWSMLPEQSGFAQAPWPTTGDGVSDALRERRALISRRCDVGTLEGLEGARLEALVAPLNQPADLRMLSQPPVAGRSAEDSGRVASALTCVAFQLSTARFDPEEIGVEARRSGRDYVVPFTFRFED